MIETLEVRSDFPLREWPSLPSEHWHRSNIGASNEGAFLKKGRIPGLHIQLNQRGSEAEATLSMNLPTLAYGSPSAKIGTLEPERFEDGVKTGLDIAHGLLPGAVPKTYFEAWHVKRYDWNMTLRPLGELPDGYCDRFIVSAAEVARRGASRQNRVDLITSGGATVTKGTRGYGRTFWRGYNKTEEAEVRGFGNVEQGLIRMEQENRPTAAQQIMLDQMAQLQEMISQDNQRIIGEWMSKAATTMMVISADQFLEAQKELDGRTNPAEAIEMATLAQMMGQYGVKALRDFGYSKPTAYRKAKRCEELLDRIGEKSYEDMLYRYWESTGWLMSEEAAETVTAPEPKAKP